MAEIFDVLVVGAGPGGAATATHLAEAGHSVLLLDRHHFPRPKACAEYANPAVAELLNRLGVLSDLGPLSRRDLDGMRVRTPAGRWFTLEYRDDSGALHSLGLPRPSLDEALVTRARRAGAVLNEGFRAQTVSRGRDALIAVTGLQDDGSTVTHRSRLVIGADGVRSAIARSLHLSLPVRWPRRLGLVAHYQGVVGLGNTGEMHVAKGAYCGLAPQPAGLTNVALVVELDAVRRAEVSVDTFFEQSLAVMPGIAERLQGAYRVDRVRGVGPLAQRVRRASAAGALLVGDAAGFLDPFTGEGIYKALRGAEIAAEVAHTALRQNDFRSTSLARYDQARRDAFRTKDALCLLVQMFVGLPPLLEYTAARLAERPSERLLLGSALGDCRPAQDALTPKFLWSVLRP